MNTDDFEIERKFLIKYPKLDVLQKCSDISEIEQTYLLSPASGCTARVRKRGKRGVYVYTHTVKTRISDMRRIEREKEVSEEEYTELLKTSDLKRSIIYKTRCCLEHMDQMFEIDIYPFWSDRAVMEIELRDEAQSVCFPPEIDIIKEITEDKRYTNSSMAKRIPYDEI